jgi:hypothetical protein
VRQFDISGVGQPRLAVYPQSGGENENAAPLHLLAGSTLWPGLLLLRLGRAGEPPERLCILPDSVAAGGFRAMALACRAIAARPQPY